MLMNAQVVSCAQRRHLCSTLESSMNKSRQTAHVGGAPFWKDRSIDATVVDFGCPRRIVN